MAYSPSLLAAAGHSQLSHHSVSPPLPHPISKREKRKHDMEERFAQIGRDFKEDRQKNFHKQIHNLQIDGDFIRNADLYADKALDEFGDDTAEDVTISATASTHGSVRTLNLNGNTKLEMPFKNGTYATKFTQVINDAMEQRDADLTTVAYLHNFRIDEILRDNEFNASVALREHQQLVEILRQRLILSQKQKKAALQKEKEKLDIADTNALLYHPNQFSLNNGASPGGPQSNRKTRHTRHRLEVEDLDAAGGSNKRKRKNLNDTENGSPAPAGREVEPANALKEANVKLEYHQAAPPLYSLDRLFSQRELDSNLQLATYEVVEDLKRRKLNKDSHTNLHSIAVTGVDSSDSEDNADVADGDGPGEDLFLAAPEMERIPTNASQHLTRSTRGLLSTKRTSGPKSLGYLAGRAAGAAFIGNVGQREKRREDEYQRPPVLSEWEQDDDLAMMKAAMEDEDAGRANWSLLDDVVEEREDYVGTGLEKEEENRIEA